MAAELAAHGAVGTPTGSGMGLAAPTILEHGSDDLKRRLLRPIVTGDHLWCQLFSEPGSGSDLAGLTTRAERDGDEWVVNGQKVWNTSADHADLRDARGPHRLGRAQAPRASRTSSLPMRQPGVEVRPLRQMNGHASFNEVFLTDARVPADNVVGEVDGGWSVALATLAHERRLGSAFGRRPKQTPTAVPSARRRPRRRRPSALRLVSAASRSCRSRSGPAARGAAAATRSSAKRSPGSCSLVQVAQWTAQRASAARALGRPPGPEGSLAKLHGSAIARAAASVHTLLAGADAS